MSDLISRSMYKSKLLKALDVLNKDYREAILNEDNDLILAIQNQQSAYVIALRLLDNEPTAYSVDKAVEELEELDDKAITRYKNGNFGDFDGVEYYIKKREAIEIVKQGGVSDVVCEWRIVDRPHNLPIYNTSCGKIRLQYATGIDIYCNGCGKKIKVVE